MSGNGKSTVPRRAMLLALACGPLFARAATERPKRLVIVGHGRQAWESPTLAGVVRILGERGFAEGRQLEVIRVGIANTAGNASVRGLDYLVPELEREVLPLKPDVILTMGSIMAKGAHLATRAIPIVASVNDPVDLGLAASLARPGGNVTGLAAGVAETAAKTMEFMKVLIPRLARVAIFSDPRPVALRAAGLYERAAKSLGLEPVMVVSMKPSELIQALRSLPARRIQAGVWVWGDGEPEEIAREAIAVRTPLVGVEEYWVEAGCLASYFAFEPAPQLRLAEIVEKILRGVQPAAIPFQYPQLFRLVLNRRTAKALGIVLAPDLLLRADRVID